MLMNAEPRYTLTKGEDSWFINDELTGESFETLARSTMKTRVKHSNSTSFTR